MNRFLAGLLKALNALFAVFIVGAGALAGSAFLPMRQEEGAITGVVIGVLVATICCGAVALFGEIHNELIEIRKTLNARPKA